MEHFVGDYSDAWNRRMDDQIELWRIQQELSIGNFAMQGLLADMISQAEQLRREDPYYWQNIIEFKKRFDGRVDEQL